jgi:hypothetical protein
VLVWSWLTPLRGIEKGLLPFLRDLLLGEASVDRAELHRAWPRVRHAIYYLSYIVAIGA